MITEGHVRLRRAEPPDVPAWMVNRLSIADWATGPGIWEASGGKRHLVKAIQTITVLLSGAANVTLVTMWCGSTVDGSPGSWRLDLAANNRCQVCARKQAAFQKFD